MLSRRTRASAFKISLLRCIAMFSATYTEYEPNYKYSFVIGNARRQESRDKKQYRLRAIKTSSISIQLIFTAINIRFYSVCYFTLPLSGRCVIRRAHVRDVPVAQIICCISIRWCLNPRTFDIEAQLNDERTRSTDNRRLYQSSLNHRVNCFNNLTKC